MRTWNNDPFTKKAQREDFAARSVYKLEEIDRRERIFESAKLVLDLGASPGSWSQYVLRKCPRTSVIAVDLNPLQVSDSRLTFYEKDISEMEWENLLGTRKADVVVSDMAPKTSGIKDRDVALSFELATLALDVAKRTLKPQGKFIVKIFMGDTFDDFEAAMKEAFKDVRRLRPESTRKHSREIFFIGKTLKVFHAAAPASVP